MRLSTFSALRRDLEYFQLLTLNAYHIKIEHKTKNKIQIIVHLIGKGGGEVVGLLFAVLWHLTHGQRQGGGPAVQHE